MPAKGSTKTSRLIKDMTSGPQIVTAIGDDHIIPNHSGVKNHPELKFTEGSILFAGTDGVITQDNANLFWDDTNERLRIGTGNAPIATLDVMGEARTLKLILSRGGIGIQEPYIEKSGNKAMSFFTIDNERMVISEGGNIDFKAGSLTTTGNLFLGAGNITTSGQINLTGASTNIITATNVNGDLRLGAGGGTNDLKIDINGNVDIFENLTVAKVATLGDASLLATSAAPTTDAMIANKKYVDDEIAGVSSTYTRTATQVVAATDSKDTTNADFFCDGTADEVQIQEAIDALPTDGGTVLLLEGNYTIAAEIAMNDVKIRLVGMGAGTILTTTTAITAVHITGSENCVESIRFKGILSSGCVGVSITGGLTQYCRVSHCWFEDSYRAISGQGRYHVINNNIIEDGSYCIDVSSTWTTITGNVVFSGSVYGILASGSNQAVTGNVVKDSARGIFISAQSSAFGNSVEGSGSFGIGTNVDNVNITGNSITDSSQSIQLINTDGGVVSSNYIQNDGSSVGAIDLDSCTKLTVSNNVIVKADTHGINVEDTNHSIISGNNIHDVSEDTDNTYDGINLNTTSTYNIISNNRISNDAANDQKYGIREASTDDDFNLIHGNICTDAQTANISSQGVNSVVSDNIAP